MGVKYLWKLIEKTGYKPSRRKLEDLKNKLVAIDASMIFYDSLWKCTTKDEDGVKKPIYGENGRLCSNVQYALEVSVTFLVAGAYPPFVFDPAVPPVQKKTELSRRNEVAKNGKKRIENKAITGEELEIAIRESIRRSLENDADVMKLLRFLGLEYLTAPDGREADAVLASLSCKGVCDFVYTNDWMLSHLVQQRFYAEASTRMVMKNMIRTLYLIV